MAFPNGSKWFIDDDNDIKQKYTLTELTATDASQLGMAEVYTGNAFPDITIFVRYPKNQPPKQPGGYLSVLAADINSVVETASTKEIEITFFKGEIISHFHRGTYGGKKRSYRRTIKTRKRNIRRRRRTNNRRNAKK